jgi:hypothetical protein
MTRESSGSFLNLDAICKVWVTVSHGVSLASSCQDPLYRPKPP